LQLLVALGEGRSGFEEGREGGRAGGEEGEGLPGKDVKEGDDLFWMEGGREGGREGERGGWKGKAESG